MSSSSIFVALVTGVIAATAALPADAANARRYDQQGASSVCQAALPDQASLLRASPMGLANLGAGMVFVTCTLQGDNTPGGRGTTLVTVDVSSSATTEVVTCTLVEGLGVAGGGTAIYSTKSEIVGGGGARFIEWSSADVSSPPDTITVPAVQCGLPPGTTLHYLTRHYTENIGG